MDYVDGKLIVDPAKMMNDFFKVSGSVTAFLISLCLDRHFIHYEIPVGHKNIPVLTAVGIGIFFSWREYFIKPTFVALLGTHTGNFISYFLGTLFGMVIFPIVITKLTKSDS